jgi:hypothetical protein
LWFRCGVDEWHLDCQKGGEINLDRNEVTPKDHDFIAAIRRNDGGLELFISSSRTKVFNSNAALNNYLRTLGLEEISLPKP